MGRTTNNNAPVIRRPVSGICQFCLKVISATNWGRHLKSSHKEDIDKMSREQSSPEEEAFSSPENSPLKFNRKQGKEEVRQKLQEDEEEEEQQKSEGAENDISDEDEDSTDVEGKPNEEVGEESKEVEDEARKASESPLRRSKRTASRRTARSTIPLPKSNICPLCQVKTSPGNWSRHLRRHHPDYSVPSSSTPTNVVLPPAPPPAHVDMPMFQLEQFLAQQMQQHNNHDFDLFANNSQFGEAVEEEEGEGGGKLLDMKGIKMELGIGEREAGAGADMFEPMGMEGLLEEGENSRSSSLKAGGAPLPKKRRRHPTVVRRPPDGICPFCLKKISSSNWSRHLRSMHSEEVDKIGGGGSKRESSSCSDEIEQRAREELGMDSAESGDDLAEDDQPQSMGAATVTAEPILLPHKMEFGECSSEMGNFDETMAAVILNSADPSGVPDIADEPVQQEQQSPLRRSQRNGQETQLELVAKAKARPHSVVRKSRSAIRLPSSGHCPLCGKACSSGNWSRHLKRHHPEYAFSGDEEEQQPGTSLEGLEFWVPTEEVRSFIIRCVQSVGASFAHAVQLAEILLDADIVGQYGNGLANLPLYVEQVASGLKKSGEPNVLREKGATAWVDGSNLLGAVVGNFCTDLAIKLAREHGIGWVLARNSDHQGNGGQYYAKRMAQVGMVGMCMANSSALPLPNGQLDGPLANSISCSANGQKPGDGLLLDMPTWPFPTGTGLEEEGEEDALPKAGNPLGMLVEVLTGVMASGARQPHQQNAANLSQCFVAIDPGCFAPGFPAGLQHFLDRTRDSQMPVPGDQERASASASQEAGALLYQWPQIQAMENLATKCRVHMFVYKPRQK